MTELAYTRILVAIESDATLYHGEHASRPGLLGRAEAEQMLAHLSTDLARLFPQIKDCALCLAGALFDQTQLLRPSYPVFSTLEKLLAGIFTGQDFQPRLLSFGAESGVMPEPELQPCADIPLGLLQTLPMTVCGEPERVATLSSSMEHQFLESGQLSAHSARALEANFGININHARFMTVTDLNAMLHLQLDHFGFLPLWQLLDAAINMPDKALIVDGRGGQVFNWNGSVVRCRFETFDYWARFGAGSTKPGSGQLLAQDYADWTREYRQYLATLSAHAITVVQFLPDNPDQALDGGFLVEESAYPSTQEGAPVTEHGSGELGTVAVTVIRGGKQFNYYPLKPSGLNTLHASIRETLGTTVGVSFPGTILYDEGIRQLRPDILRSDSSR